MKKHTWSIAIVALICSGAYYFYQTHNTHLDPRDADDFAVMERYTRPDFTWRVENTPNYEETMPHQKVYLNVKDNSKNDSYEAGESMGCTGTPDTATQEASATTMTRCWFAGGGDDYAVFEESGIYVLKHRWTQESGGPEVNADPEGPWEVVTTIK